MKISGYASQSYPQPTAVKLEQKGHSASALTKPAESAAPVDLALMAQGTNSSTAVRLPAEGYASRLTDAEKKALDAIFARYRENPALAQRLESTGSDLGRLVDVKV